MNLLNEISSDASEDGDDFEVPEIETDSSEESDVEFDDHADTNVNETLSEFLSKDGRSWTHYSNIPRSVGKQQKQNILKVKPGPTSYSTTRVIMDDPLSAFRFFLTKACFVTFKSV